jgi:3-oxoacyl-[acyl-carrier protein] reductase
MNKNILEGKNILVIGASRGLGATIVKTVWNYGANVMMVSRNEKKMRDVTSSLNKNENQTSYIFPKDLSSPGAIESIINFSQEKFGRLDALVNNAAIQGPIGPLWENDWILWENTVNVNLITPIKLSRLCAKWMIPHRRGKIICLSGGGATGSRPNFSSYAVAKTGLVRFCEIFADELKLYNIQVNSIAPGAMATSLLDNVVTAGPILAGKREYEAAIKVQRNGGASLEKASHLVAFLASELSDGITGKLISAVWDPWKEFPEHLDELKKTDIYTLRRIVPKERGMGWGEV